MCDYITAISAAVLLSWGVVVLLLLNRLIKRLEEISTDISRLRRSL